MTQDESSEQARIEKRKELDRRKKERRKNNSIDENRMVSIYKEQQHENEEDPE